MPDDQSEALFNGLKNAFKAIEADDLVKIKSMLQSDSSYQEIALGFVKDFFDSEMGLEIID